jgi:hypothetical protein
MEQEISNLIDGKRWGMEAILVDELQEWHGYWYYDI